MPTLLSSSFKPHPFLTGSRSPGGALGPQTLVGPRGFRCVGSAPTRRVESDSFGPGRGFASGFHIDAAARYSWYKARSSRLLVGRTTLAEVTCHVCGEVC